VSRDLGGRDALFIKAAAMDFLKSVTFVDNGPALTAGDLVLKPPQMADYAEWARLRELSREFLTPWEPGWSDDELSRAAFRRRLKYYQRDIEDETGYAFFLHRVHDKVLLGGISLSNIRRGVSQSCSIGYWIGVPYARQGVMTAAMKPVIGFVFNTLALHRLEAACLPHNQASVSLLERAGFTREGLARRYLKINGVWQDHLQYALLDEDPRA
jgi:[ribosomal protein S5]-alanine N-acetyltransferase